MPGTAALPARNVSWPLSLVQQHLWAKAALRAGDPLYHLTLTLTLTGPLQVSALEQSFIAFIGRHQILRLAITGAVTHPEATLLPPRSLVLPVVDLSLWPHSEQLVEAERLMAEEAQQPFNFAKGRLARARLVKLAAATYVLVLVGHHLICDEAGAGLMVRELLALYAAFATGQAPNLLPAPQYVDFVQATLVAHPTSEATLTYWQKELAGPCLPLALPTDYGRVVPQLFESSTHVFSLSKSLLAQLQTLCQAAAVSLDVLLLAAFQVWLYQHTAQTTFIFGVPVSNRVPPWVNMLGPMARLLPVRAQVSDKLTFGAFLVQVNTAWQVALSCQDFPVETLVGAHNLAFRAGFGFRAESLPVAQIAGVQFAPLVLNNSLGELDITLWLEVTAHGLAGRLEYNARLFHTATIRRWVGHWQNLLLELDLALRLADLPFLPLSAR